jgi:hypothetical protein
MHNIYFIQYSKFLTQYTHKRRKSIFIFFASLQAAGSSRKSVGSFHLGAQFSNVLFSSFHVYYFYFIPSRRKLHPKKKTLLFWHRCFIYVRIYMEQTQSFLNANPAQGARLIGSCALLPCIWYLSAWLREGKINVWGEKSGEGESAVHISV